MVGKESTLFRNIGGPAPSFRGMRGSLLAWFVILTLVPMALVSTITYIRAREALTQDATDKLVAVREIKQDILVNLFRRWKADLVFVSQLEDLKDDMMDLAAGYRFLGAEKLRRLYLGKPDLLNAEDGSAFSVVHQDRHRFFRSYRQVQGYEDVFLIDLEGNVLYSTNKDPDFGASLTSEPYRESNLGRLYQAMRGARMGEVLMGDAAVYGNGVALFMGIPIYREDICLGYLVTRLPLGHINERMNEREGMGQTGETYLVGPDHRFRSDSSNDPANRTVKASLSGTVKGNGVDTASVREALAGRSGVRMDRDYRGTEVLSAYSPVSLEGLQWAIVASLSAEEALAPAASLLWVTLGVGCGAALLAVLLAVLVSGRIVRPIRRLTDWSRRIAGGELDMVDINAPKNEVGVLNASFREAVNSLRAAREAQERHNWLKTGRANLDDRMRGELVIEKLCDQVVSYVVQYLGAQVGTFYVNDGNGLFRLKGGYAFKAPKNNADAFKRGEGLIGQAALEKKPILLTNVPSDYLTVASGLGESTVRNILITPLVFNDATLGVIEIGTIDEFTEDHQILLGEIAERIAIAIHSATARHDLQRALDVTLRQSEKLKTQQEELQVINEELEEQTQQLQDSEERLKSQQEELRTINEELEEKTLALEDEKRLISRKNLDLETIGRELERRTKELEITSHYKSEFLANMSHELRTPLNSLLLLAKDLAANKNKNLDELQTESANIICKSGQELLSLINEILDLSKIEAGRMDLHPEAFDPTELAAELVAEFKPQANAKGIALNLRLGEDRPDSIVSDPQRLAQILRNLLSNAIKFTSKGSVTLDICRPKKGTLSGGPRGLDPKEAVALSVVDTGIGISEDKQSLVFEPFQQGDGSTSRLYGGTGLGLSISRELAKLLGGEIVLESKESEGSTFTLYLPEKLHPTAKISEEGRTKDVRAAPKPQTRVPLEPIKDDRDVIQDNSRVILVIEDDPNFAQILYRFCHERHFHCLHATDGESGLKLAAQYKPDALILDIQLPGIGGWTVLETLKSDPGLRHIPIHMISVEKGTIEAFRKGAIGFLSKPVDSQQLAQAFNRIEDVIQRNIKRLLVVEDDPVMRKKIAELIGNGDVETKTVGTGREAVEELRTQAYDCVILDLKLPDISGFGVLEQMELSKDVSVPPIIIYTGKDLTHEEEYRLQKYASSIIVKGVKSQERLLDETALFLHRVIEDLPTVKKKMISTLYDGETIFKGKKVLLVDDDMRNVFALTKLLEEKGMEVFKAADGQKSLEILEKYPDMNMVLMDIMMPVMDGFEAMRRIRSQDRFQSLPILAITAKAMKEDRTKCIEAGANDYLSKPIDPDKLFSLMRVWLYR